MSDVCKGDTFTNFWQSKFEISKASKILTVGSCFAQHISSWLIANGYSWVEAEPAPRGLTSEIASSRGHGIFSFRTGNIYTPALLRQWLALALGDRPPIEECWEEGGRYFDPLRPHLPPDGYSSDQALFSDREASLAAISQAVREADVLIFTLGLTEAWHNTQGFVYPSCPGTIRGQFRSHEHYFVNHDYASICADLNWIVNRLKLVRPELKFLLTVSPVPLTATATDTHVLPATTYSKSVLRSAAGHVATTFNDVDYFPSYELITSQATKTNFFESNLRTVRPEGVDFVMRHFATGVGEAPEHPAEKLAPRKFVDPIDAVCEDVLLETWNASSFLAEEDPRLCLFGDSHMGKLSQALSDVGVHNHGGMIMNGSAWTSNLFHLDKEEIFVPLENAGARQRWQEILPFFLSPDPVKWVITNIGMQTHRSVHEFIAHLKALKINTITDQVFADYYHQVNASKISLIKTLVSNGFRVLILSDPPTRSCNPQISEYLHFWEYYDQQALKLMHSIGCAIFNAGLYFSKTHFKDSYYSSVVYADGTRDWFHGSDTYYTDLAQALINTHLQPTLHAAQ